MADHLAVHSSNHGMDRPTSLFRQGRELVYLWLALVPTSAAIATALILYDFGGRAVPPEHPTTLSAPSPAVQKQSQQPGEGPDPSYVEVDGHEIEPKSLADAFEAATGHRTVFSTHSKWDSIRTEPLRIVELPFGPALLTEDRNSETHANAGAIGVYYLKEHNGRFRVTGSWPRAVEGWDWGAPPEWRLTNRFTANPAIYAWGDFMAQGIITRSSTLTELAPEGPWSPI